MNRLPYDVCRCLDGGCPERKGCLRWERRNDAGYSVPKVSTLRMESDGKCQNRIPAEGGGKDE